MEIGVSQSAIIELLENIIIKIDNEIGNRNKPIAQCSLNELNFSAGQLAAFTDLINETCHLKLSQKDVLGIRTIKGLIEVIAELA